MRIIRLWQYRLKRFFIWSEGGEAEDGRWYRASSARYTGGDGAARRPYRVSLLREGGGRGGIFANGLGAAEVFDDGFSPGPDLELFVYVPDMGMNGGVSDAHTVGDFLVEITFGQ